MEVICRCGVCVVERVMGGWCESVCGRGGEGRLACVGGRGVMGGWCESVCGEGRLACMGGGGEGRLV